ncbi:hypothetical protein [Aneurinibacillus tyrosinisolvens]|jgi:hypothetical protein|uniref:hypothetical protein n=1 Tax=Aneurinibacillus tyrosinisolvens TaxID=1443435 RepID=UPI00063F4D80|nr:hypothetical protein [Aneurinibacillus tyrosinisolvens]
MKIENALFDYLQIKVVADARPDDTAAQKTSDFFYSILQEEHKLENLEYTVDDTMYHVKYTADGKSKTRFYDRESIEHLLSSIETEPRYGK